VLIPLITCRVLTEESRNYLKNITRVVYARELLKDLLECSYLNDLISSDQSTPDIHMLSQTDYTRINLLYCNTGEMVTCLFPTLPLTDYLTHPRVMLSYVPSLMLPIERVINNGGYRIYLM